MTRYTASLLTALLLLLLASCSSDSSDAPGVNGAPYGEPTLASFTLATRSDTSTPTDAELINDWWMAFVNADSIVVKIVDGAPASATDRDSLTIQLDEGPYTIYAFANMGTADPSTARFGFVEGRKAPKNIESTTWSTIPAYGSWVPMTGRLEVNIKQQASTRFVIEVVRLVAKMELQIINDTGNDITLNRVELVHAVTDKVTLLPDYSTLAAEPVLPADVKYSDFTKDYSRAINYGDSYTDIFYLPESSARTHPTGHYTVMLDITHESGRREKISALTPTLQWISRNDHIILPVKLVDFSLAFDVTFYPPIGGYPAVMLESNADEYYATFGSSGKFVINPQLRDNSGKVLAPDEYTIATPLEVNDPNGILSEPPTIDDTTFEITGTLAQGDRRGTATVKFNITAPYTGSSTPIYYLFTRTLYIIRQ